MAVSSGKSLFKRKTVYHTVVNGQKPYMKGYIYTILILIVKHYVNLISGASCWCSFNCGENWHDPVKCKVSQSGLFCHLTEKY